MAMFIQRNGALFGGMILTAIVFLLARPVFENSRGVYIPAVLQADSVVTSALVVLVCLAIVTAVGIVVTRLTNVCVAMFVIGAGLYALDYRLATSSETLLSGSLTSVAVELFFWFLVVLGIVLVLFRLGGPLRDVQPDEDGRTPSPFTSIEALKAAAAGVLVLPAVWLLAVSNLSGQGVGAAFIGAMLAGLIGRLVSPHVQPILLFASPLLFATIGAIIGIAMVDGPTRDLFISGDLPSLLRPAPVDYVVGCIAGVAVGYGWARSFLHHDDEDEPAAAVSASTTADR